MTNAPRSTRAAWKGHLPARAEERDLVRRMRAGDQGAFEAFADHYIPGLYRFATARLGQQRELTRDIVQTTICKVIEKLDSYRGEAPLFTWLCACCRNEIAGHYRRQQAQPSVALAPDDFIALRPDSTLVSVVSDPEELLLETESAGLVNLTLDHLPPRYASALEWKYLEGLSIQQIAERLELGAKAAESVLTRARKAFRVAYERLAEGPAAARSRQKVRA